MGALAHPIGIRVEDETALEDWLDEIAQRVMDDAIANFATLDSGVVFMRVSNNTSAGPGTLGLGWIERDAISLPNRTVQPAF